MPMDQDVSIGELYRLLKSIDQRLEKFVTKDEFNVRMDTANAAIERTNHELNNKAIESGTIHAKQDAARDTQITELRKEMREQRDQLEAQEREKKQQTRNMWTAVGLSVLGFLFAIARDFIGPLGG